MSNGILVEVVHGSDDSTVELPFAGDTDVVEEGATAPCSEPRFDRPRNPLLAQIASCRRRPTTWNEFLPISVPTVAIVATDLFGTRLCPFAGRPVPAHLRAVQPTQSA